MQKVVYTVLYPDRWR